LFYSPAVYFIAQYPVSCSPSSSFPLLFLSNQNASGIWYPISVSLLVPEMNLTSVLPAAGCAY